MDEIKIVSWNVKYFTPLLASMKEREKNPSCQARYDLARETFHQLVQKTCADVYVFQETPIKVKLLLEQENELSLGKKLTDPFVRLLDDDLFPKCSFQREVSGEHLFYWRKERDPPLDGSVVRLKLATPSTHARTLAIDPMLRPPAQLTFDVLGQNLLLSLVSVHTSPGKHNNEVPPFLKNRFWETDQTLKKASAVSLPSTHPEVIHVVCGDVNFNPHHLFRQKGEKIFDQKNPSDRISPLDAEQAEAEDKDELAKTIRNDWFVTGSVHTRTSAGGRGYDFFFVDRKSVEERVDATQTVIVQHKIHIAGDVAVSDHDPVCLTLSFRRRLTLQKTEAG